MNRLEKHFEEDVIDYAEQLGGEAWKLKKDGERGFPDRTLFLPGGVLTLVELKRPKVGKTSPQQKKILRRLQELGFTAKVCDDLDDVRAAVHAADIAAGLIL